MKAATKSFRIVPKKQAKKPARNPELQRKIESLAEAMLRLAYCRQYCRLAIFPQFSIAVQRHAVERRLRAVVKEAARGR